MRHLAGHKIHMDYLGISCVAAVEFKSCRSSHSSLGFSRSRLQQNFPLLVMKGAPVDTHAESSAFQLRSINSGYGQVLFDADPPLDVELGKFQIFHVVPRPLHENVHGVVHRHHTSCRYLGPSPPSVVFGGCLVGWPLADEKAVVSVSVELNVAPKACFS